MQAPSGQIKKKRKEKKLACLCCISVIFLHVTAENVTTADERAGVVFWEILGRALSCAVVENPEKEQVDSERVLFCPPQGEKYLLEGWRETRGCETADPGGPCVFLSPLCVIQDMLLGRLPKAQRHRVTCPQSEGLLGYITHNSHI